MSFARATRIPQALESPFRRAAPWLCVIATNHNRKGRFHVQPRSGRPLGPSRILSMTSGGKEATGLPRMFFLFVTGRALGQEVLLSKAGFQLVRLILDVRTQGEQSSRH